MGLSEEILLVIKGVDNSGTAIHSFRQGVVQAQGSVGLLRDAMLNAGKAFDVAPALASFKAIQDAAAATTVAIGAEVDAQLAHLRRLGGAGFGGFGGASGGGAPRTTGGGASGSAGGAPYFVAQPAAGMDPAARQAYLDLQQRERYALDLAAMQGLPLPQAGRVATAAVAAEEERTAARQLALRLGISGLGEKAGLPRAFSYGAALLGPAAVVGLGGAALSLYSGHQASVYDQAVRDTLSQSGFGTNGPNFDTAYQQLSQGIQDYVASGKSPYRADVLARTVEPLLAHGFGVGAVLQALPSIADVSYQNKSPDLTTVANFVNTMAATRGAGKATSGAQLTDYADFLSRMETMTSIPPGQISRAMPNLLAASYGTGVGVDDLGALMLKVGTAQPSARLDATSLFRLVTELTTKNTAGAQKTAAALGLRMGSGAVQSYGGIFPMLQAYQQATAGPEQGALLAKLFPQANALKSFEYIFGGGGLTQAAGYLPGLTNRSDAAQRTYAQMAQGTQLQSTELLNRFNGDLIALGTTMNKTVVPALLRLASAALEGAEGFLKHPGDEVAGVANRAKYYAQTLIPGSSHFLDTAWAERMAAHDTFVKSDTAARKRGDVQNTQGFWGVLNKDGTFTIDPNQGTPPAARRPPPDTQRPAPSGSSGGHDNWWDAIGHVWDIGGKVNAATMIGRPGEGTAIRTVLNAITSAIGAPNALANWLEPLPGTRTTQHDPREDSAARSAQAHAVTLDQATRAAQRFAAALDARRPDHQNAPFAHYVTRSGYAHQVRADQETHQQALDVQARYFAQDKLASTAKGDLVGLATLLDTGAQDGRIQSALSGYVAAVNAAVAGGALDATKAGKQIATARRQVGQYEYTGARGQFDEALSRYKQSGSASDLRALQAAEARATGYLPDLGKSQGQQGYLAYAMQSQVDKAANDKRVQAAQLALSGAQIDAESARIHKGSVAQQMQAAQDVYAKQLALVNLEASLHQLKGKDLQSARDQAADVRDRSLAALAQTGLSQVQERATLAQLQNSPAGLQAAVAATATYLTAHRGQLFGADQTAYQIALLQNQQQTATLQRLNPAMSLIRPQSNSLRLQEAGYGASTAMLALGAGGGKAETVALLQEALRKDDAEIVELRQMVAYLRRLDQTNQVTAANTRPRAAPNRPRDNRHAATYHRR